MIIQFQPWIFALIGKREVDWSSSKSLALKKVRSMVLFTVQAEGAVRKIENMWMSIWLRLSIWKSILLNNLNYCTIIKLAVLFYIFAPSDLELGESPSHQYWLTGISSNHHPHPCYHHHPCHLHHLLPTQVHVIKLEWAIIDCTYNI